MPYWSDLVGVGATYLMIFLTILVAEGLRKAKGYSPAFTRKIIHVGVGNWVFLWPLFFRHWFIAMIPPLSFIFINYASYRKELIKAMEVKERAGLGTVYYAFSNTVLVAASCYINRLIVGAVGVMIMTWADGLADVIGRRVGKHKYTVGGSTKSVEGSIGFLIIAIIASAITLAYYGYSVAAALPTLLIISLASTIVEAVSPKGTDNLTVPLLASLLYALLA